MSFVGQWVSKHLSSPPTPKAISASENRQQLAETQKKIDDAAKPERDRIMQQYQRRGLRGQLSRAPQSIIDVATPSSQQPRRSERLSSAKSSTSALTLSPDLLQQTATSLDFGEEKDTTSVLPRCPLPRPRLSNINEETTQSSSGVYGNGDDVSTEGDTNTVEFTCCTFELCRSNTNPGSNEEVVFCMQCTQQT
jgi:hypothetical protein